MSTQMNTTPMTSEKQEKLSYEDLQSYAIDCESKLKGLSEKYNELVREYINLKQSQVFIRLEFLFKVVNAPSMFSQNFINQCVEEIQELLTIPEEDKMKSKENTSTTTEE